MNQIEISNILTELYISLAVVYANNKIISRGKEQKINVKCYFSLNPGE